MPSFSDNSSAKGNLTLVSSKTLTGTATNITFLGLDGDADGRYILVCTLLHSAAADKVSLQINGDTTKTNYYTQKICGNNAAISTARGNANTLHTIQSGKEGYGEIIIYRPANSYGFATGYFEVDEGSTLEINQFNLMTKAAISNIISIALVVDTNLLTAGSTASLYKLTRE